MHASGLAITPVFGMIDEDGNKAWWLHVQPELNVFDCLMRLKVGDEAWRRLHDQGWQLCVERSRPDAHWRAACLLLRLVVDGPAGFMHRYPTRM